MKMEYINKNIISLSFVLFFSIYLSISEKNKLKSMFSISDTKDISSSGSVLLIIAHPDDEIMFWTPTIKYLMSYNLTIKILCLSNGNYYGIGEIREKEFYNVAKELKMEESQILNIPELQDNINIKWDPNVVSKQIQDFLALNKDVKIILTFDNNGVTKHPNHISCNEGLKNYVNNNKEELIKNGIQIYFLDSFNFALQYTFIFPFLNYLFKRNGYMTMYFYYSYKWMKIYKSQFNLLRKVHTIMSGYSFFNSYTKYEIK